MKPTDRILPYSVDLRIIGACDLRCPFCFGPRHELSAIEHGAIQRLLPLLRDHGVGCIVISGGEPVLVKWLPSMLRQARQLGLKTVLSTNGILFEQRLSEIAPNLDWVALPLDGDNVETNSLMRVGNPEHFHVVMRLIPRIRDEYPQLRIKVGTVVCQLNADSVVGIPELLGKERKPDTWKLYQVVYSSYGRDNQQLVELSDAQYDEIYNLACRRAGAFDLHLVPFRRRERSGKYLFFEPNGDVLAVVDGEEQVVGNFMLNPASIFPIWREYVDTARLNSNVLDTYPGL